MPALVPTGGCVAAARSAASKPRMACLTRSTVSDGQDSKCVTGLAVVDVGNGNGIAADDDGLADDFAVSLDTEGLRPRIHKMAECGATTTGCVAVVVPPGRPDTTVWSARRTACALASTRQRVISCAMFEFVIRAAARPPPLRAPPPPPPPPSPLALEDVYFLA